MAMRLQELHPAIVHFPIALLPTALGADILGRLTGNQTLLDAGRRTMPLVAVSAVVAGIAGLIAQEAVEVEGETHDLLVTHRNLNLGLIGLTVVMAQKRVRRTRPTAGYLLAGAAGVGLMSYTAYLGGQMVYDHGVGIKPAGGVKNDQAPEIRAENAGEVAQLAARHVEHGARHALEHLRQGKIAPALGADAKQSEEAREP